MKDVIIIPTYNERENINILIPLIFNILPDVHVVIADDNSPDNTALAVTSLHKLYPNLSLITRKEKDGLAGAYINAISKTLEDKNINSIIMMDADFATQLKYLPEMILKNKEYSVVIGSRHAKGSKMIGVNLPRRVLSYLGNLYCKIILQIPIHDYSCDYMVISSDLIRRTDLSKIVAKGYSFIPQLKYLLYKAGANFFEVPIIFKERTNGESKISYKIIFEGILSPWKILFKK